MEERAAPPGTVDEYIARFPADVRAILVQIRATIKEAAPAAAERLGYGMPGYYLNGGLVWFGAFKRHVGFYPEPSGLAAFKERLAPYRQSKGAVQFQLNEPVPYELIGDIVRYRVAENNAKKRRK